MHRVIAILLASTCMVYSRKVNPYPLSIPIDYFPQEYKYVYNNRPYSDNIVYSTSITRTDENLQPDKIFIEPTIVHENDPLSSTSPNPHESEKSSEEPEITSPSSPSLPSKEVQKNKYPNTGFSSDTSYDDRPKSLSSIASPSNIYQKRPEYQDDNEYLSNTGSPLSKNYQERPQELPKYQGNNEYPSNNGSPSSKSYQKRPQERPKYQQDNEYPSNNGSPPSKNYQERSQELPKYQGNNEYPSNDGSPSAKSYQKLPQERPKYQQDNEYPSNNGSPSSKSYQKRPQERPKYQQDNEYPSNNGSPPSKNYQERSQELPKYQGNNEYPSNDGSPSAKSYQKLPQERPKYQQDNEYPSNNGSPSSKSYQKRPQERPKYQQDNEYPSNNGSPPSKNYQERSQELPKYQGNNEYPSNDGSPSAKSYQKLPQERPKYQQDNEYPSNNGSPPSKSYQERPQELPKYLDNYKHPNDVSSPLKSYKERPKYSNYNKFPSNDPPSEPYQKRPENSKEYKYPYYISIPPKPYQERPKYEEVSKFSPKNVYPVQTTYQERLKYENLYEFPLNNGLPSQKTRKERPKYPMNYKNPEYLLPSESSSEEKPKYLSYYNESKSYLELPKYLPNKMVLSPSKAYEDSVDDKYHVIPSPEYLAPQYPDIDYSGSWHAPSFYQYLKDFEETENIVESRIFGKGLKQNEKQYTIIAGVLDGMIKTMANTPWRFYDQAYDVNMPKLFKYARVTRHVVNAQMKCIYEWINHGIEKMRAIMNNSWINYICSVSDVPCDTLVLAIVDTSNDVDLQKEARLLLAIGKAAGLFLNRYAKTLDRQARTNRPSNLYTLLSGSKKYFQPLIKAGSEARKLLPSTYSCYDAPTHTPDEERGYK